MIRIIATIVLATVGALLALALTRLSADAIGLGVGVLFGVLAGIPTALLLLASQRRSNAAQASPPPAPRNAPPIIVVAGVHALPQPNYDPYGGRQGYAPALPDNSHVIDARPYHAQLDYQQRFDQEYDW